MTSQAVQGIDRAPMNTDRNQVSHPPSASLDNLILIGRQLMWEESKSSLGRGDKKC